MQVTETLSEGLKRGFTVVVPGEDIESRRTARLTDLGKTLRLPGFRPGKGPLPIVRQRYGNAVTAEVLEESVNQATEKVISERNMRPAQTPKIDLVTTDIAGAGAAKALEFKVEFELLPDIALPDFGQISLVRRKAEVPAELVDKSLAEMAARNRELVEITPEELEARGEHPGAATGEVLTVDFIGKIDGVPFPNGAGNDVNVELGGTGFIPGFADQLEGMRPGEIFALRWKSVADQVLRVEQRVYKRILNTPKNGKTREGAISDGTGELLQQWSHVVPDTQAEAFVFSSEAGTTPLSPDNLWRRSMKPKLMKIGLGWATFQILRKTNASLSQKAGVDPKVASDQRGHGIGVSLDVYTSSDMEQKKEALQKLEAAMLRKSETQKQSA